MACRTLCRTCHQVGRYNILDKHKIPALSAVTKNNRCLAGRGPGHKNRYYTRIGRTWILTRTVYVEIAEAHGFQPVEFMIQVGIIFTGQFLQSIRALASRPHTLILGQPRIIAVNRTRTGQHHPPDPALTSGLQNSKRSHLIHQGRLKRFFHGLRHRYDGGLVKNDIASGHCPAYGIRVLNISLKECNPALQVL